MMDINALAAKVNGEIVGGRLIAVVDGKKQYLSGVSDSGEPFLTELGLQISNELSFAKEPVVEAEAPAPKRSRRKAETVEVDIAPEQIEIDI
jgi:hypothetical protein